LKSFAAAVKELKDSEVIRSDRYLGDIAEFLCADAYGINLTTNLREVGHDGLREELKVQIKYAGGTKTNMDFGDPAKYDEVYVVLGKGSFVRRFPHDADFLIYKNTSDEVFAFGDMEKQRFSRGPTYFTGPPNKTVSLSDFLG
jgi:hypothetical protein